MSKKVLIVDDSIYMRSLIKSAMEGAGFEVVGEAQNGESAIDLAVQLQPDLITLDNILPDMMGFEILIKSKKNMLFVCKRLTSYYYRDMMMHTE